MVIETMNMENIRIYKTLSDELDDIIADYENFMEDVLGVGEENIFGEKILEYSIKCNIIEFYERKTELLKAMEKFRMHIMKEIPSAYPIYQEILPEIETEIASLEKFGSIETPLQIKMMLELIRERIRTAIEVGEPSELLTQVGDVEKHLEKIYTKALQRIAKSKKALLVFQVLLDYSSRTNPLSIRDIERITKKKATFVNNALKEILQTAPEIIRIRLVEGEYKYYIPERYKKFNVR